MSVAEFDDAETVLNEAGGSVDVAVAVVVVDSRGIVEFVEIVDTTKDVKVVVGCVTVVIGINVVCKSGFVVASGGAEPESDATDEAADVEGTVLALAVVVTFVICSSSGCRSRSRRSSGIDASSSEPILSLESPGVGSLDKAADVCEGRVQQINRYTK